MQRKVADLESRGYNVKQMWECQWAQLKQNDSAVRDLVNKLKCVSPLNPRNAFCGGRTNAIKLYHQTEADEKVVYYDFTSLYPYVNKNGLYPIGHPEIISWTGRWHVPVLCHRRMYCPPALRALSPRHTATSEGQTDVPALPHFCRGRDKQTHART